MAGRLGTQSNSLNLMSATGSGSADRVLHALSLKEENQIITWLLIISMFSV